MIQSLSRLPHSRAAGATAAIIDLDPELVAPPAGGERLAQIIQAALQMGVGQLQFNVTTVDASARPSRTPKNTATSPSAWPDIRRCSACWTKTSRKWSSAHQAPDVTSPANADLLIGRCKGVPIPIGPICPMSPIPFPPAHSPHTLILRYNQLPCASLGSSRAAATRSTARTACAIWTWLPLCTLSAMT